MCIAIISLVVAAFTGFANMLGALLALRDCSLGVLAQQMDLAGESLAKLARERDQAHATFPSHHQRERSLGGP
jgi:hypothetical protein